MRLKIMRVIAVVVALVVPLQGMAAVTAGVCMALGHHDMAAGHETPSADTGADGDDHLAHSHDAETEQEDSGGGNPHCGPCIACCTSASVSGPVAFSISSLPTDVAYVFTQSPPPSVQLDGLDRPPLAL